MLNIGEDISMHLKADSIDLEVLLMIHLGYKSQKLKIMQILQIYKIWLAHNNGHQVISIHIIQEKQVNMQIELLAKDIIICK